MNPGGGQNLASSLTAALAPTLLQGSSSSSGVGTGSSTNSTKDKDNPKIKITDEHDHIVSIASASDSSQLNDIRELSKLSNSSKLNFVSSDSLNSSAAELPEGNGSQGGVLPPLVASPRSSFSGQGAEDPTSSSTYTHVRPPSPVLPRRKSSGTGMRGVSFSASGVGGPGRRLSWNRKDSGGGELLSSIGGGEGKEVRKKSLTWCEESVERVSAATEKRRASRKSFDAGGLESSNPNDRWVSRKIDNFKKTAKKINKK